jgi:hypothetical protein
LPIWKMPGCGITRKKHWQRRTCRCILCPFVSKLAGPLSASVPPRKRPSYLVARRAGHASDFGRAACEPGRPGHWHWHCQWHAPGEPAAAALAPSSHGGPAPACCQWHCRGRRHWQWQWLPGLACPQASLATRAGQVKVSRPNPAGRAGPLAAMGATRQLTLPPR